MQPTSNTTEYDFSSLENLKGSITLNAYVTAIAAVVFMFTVSATVTLAGSSSIFLIYACFAVIVTATIVTGYTVSKRNNEHNQQLLNQVAAANGWTYVIKAGDGNGSHGTIFNHGHSKSITNALRGNLNNLPFEFGNYSYTTGSGKNQTVHNLHLMKLTLPRVLPHMVIDSLVEGVGQSTLPIEFDASQRITLEGDFSKYFHLYAPDSYGVTALTILAPDAMQTLLESAAYCDMEIVGNEVYFYWPGKATSRQQYEESFATVEKVMGEIGKSLTVADIFTSSEQSTIHSSPVQAVKLRKSWLSRYSKYVAVAAFIAYFIGQTLSSIPGLEVVSGLAYFGLVLGPSLFIAYRIYNKRRLRIDLASRYR